MRVTTNVLVLATVLSLSAVIATTGTARAGGILDWSVGVKGGGGGDVWLSPDAGTGFASLAGRSQDFFTETRGGWTYGGGVFAELRILKFLGIETGLLFFQDVIKQDTDRGSVSTEERFEWTTMRIPILVKGVLPLGIVRLWLGVGPEFSIPIGSSASISVPGSTPPAFQFETRTDTDVYLAAGLGVVISIGPIGIPIDVRFGWNATQPGSYEELVTFDAQGNVLTGATIRASNTIDARLLVGVAYEF